MRTSSDQLLGRPVPPFQQLSAAEQTMVAQAISSVAFRDLRLWFFPPREIPLRCNRDQALFQNAYARLPHLDDSDQSGDDYCIINGALNEACNGYGGYLSASEWSELFTCSRSDLLATYSRWKSLHGRKVGRL